MFYRRTNKQTKQDSNNETPSLPLLLHLWVSTVLGVGKGFILLFIAFVELIAELHTIATL